MHLLHRRDGGRALRDAMTAAGLSIPALARATREIDPTGRGVSRSLIGRLVSGGASARDRCRLRAAWLIADALRASIQSLFAMPIDSTSTLERSRDGHLQRSPAHEAEGH